MVVILFLVVPLILVMGLIVLPPTMHRFLGRITGHVIQYIKAAFRRRSSQPMESKDEDLRSYEEGYQAFSSTVPQESFENLSAQYPDLPQASYPELPQQRRLLQQPPI
jgi:hypothetical protein